MNEEMNNNSRIYVAGHTGLVGSAILRQLKHEGYHNLILRTHSELDLTDQLAVEKFFKMDKPDYVFLAAAKVGGILANNLYPVEFIYENLTIQTNVIHQSYLNGVKRLLFLGSSCIYPRDCPQPIKEEYLLTGPLEPTNRPYALAKIAGIEMCWAYNRQYGTEFIAAMPTNVYGPGDNYDLETSHVLPALIRKMHEAKAKGDNSVTVWGTGKPRREFIFSDDLADACIFLLEQPPLKLKNILLNNDCAPMVNIACGKDKTIKELVDIIKDVVGFKGKIKWDTSKPDGTPRKLLDVSRMENAGWTANTNLSEGINQTYADYCRHERKYVRV